MRASYKLLLSFMVAGAVAAPAVQASPVVFFGRDPGAGEFARVPHPNADTARSGFLTNLTGVGTENFEGFATGSTSPITLNFPGAGTATLNGASSIATVVSGTNGAGRYAISGQNFWETGSGFGIAFSKPISAFGFYGVDIGDFSGQVTLTLSNGTLLTVPTGVGLLGGGVVYYGFYDTAATFTSVTFGNTATGVDFFGFDDMTVGSLEQVRPSVPEPSSLLLAGGGLAALLLARRRKTAA